MDSETNTDVDGALKNRRVFNDVHVIAGLPAGVFLAGVSICLILVVGTRSLWGALLFAPLYFIPMYSIHKHDIRALKVWMAVLGDKVARWEAGKAKHVEVLIKHRQR